PQDTNATGGFRHRSLDVQLELNEFTPLPKILNKKSEQYSVPFRFPFFVYICNVITKILYFRAIFNKIFRNHTTLQNFLNINDTS
ncbi:MAG: hypothetical protein QMD10_02035, partial [Desulfitobacteriaceae bacterium]|nr:hypothetical protein [Desulfitobacteriaceae bacterium]